MIQETRLRTFPGTSAIGETVKMKRFFYLLVILVLVQGTAFAERTIIQDNALYVTVSDDYQCQEKIELSVVCPKNRYFNGDMVEVQKLVDVARNVLGFECSKIKEIKVTGLVSGKLVYNGLLSEKNGWKLARPKSPDKKESIPKVYVNKNNEVVIYKSDHLSITSPLAPDKRLRSFKSYNNLTEWRQSRDQLFLSAAYDVDHDDRDALFYPSYEKFFLDKVFPVLDKARSLTDGSHPGAYNDVFFFLLKKKGEEGYWDQIVFTVRYAIHRDGTRKAQYLAKNYTRLGARKYLSKEAHTALFYKMNKNGLMNIKGEELYEDEYISIYPNNFQSVNTKIDSDGWCGNPELFIVYKMPLDERDRIVTFEYLSPIVWDILSGYCDVPAHITLKFFPEGEDSFWDYTMYQYCRLGSLRDQCNADNSKFAYGIERGPYDGPLKQMEMIKESRKNAMK